MRTLLRLLLLFVIACLGPVSRPQVARAQTVTIPQALGFEIIRKDERPDSELPLIISTQDCLDDDPTEADYNEDAEEGEDPGSRTWIELNLALSDPSPRYTLEFWASQTADCTDNEQRNGTAPQCRKIGADEQANVLAPQIRLYPRSILVSGGYSGSPTDVADYPDAETCDNQQENALVIWVLLFNGDTLLDSATWDRSGIDTLPPPTPSSLTAGPGDQLLFLDWDIPQENEEEDTDGFTFFCAPVDYVPEDSTADDDAANGGAGGQSFASCPLETFEAGDVPESDFFECGYARGRSARDGQTNLLNNNQAYAVYVTSTDTVGNQSDASDYGCATPQEVITFFEQYKEDGGRGGGGYCAFSLNEQTSLWLLLACTLLLLVARRRGSLS